MFIGEGIKFSIKNPNNALINFVEIVEISNTLYSKRNLQFKNDFI